MQLMGNILYICSTQLVCSLLLIYLPGQIITINILACGLVITNVIICKKCLIIFLLQTINKSLIEKYDALRTMLFK